MIIVSGIYIGCMIVELAFIFFGFTLFQDHMNMLLIFLHSIGCFASSYFLLRPGHYDDLKFIMILFGIIPLLLETFSVIKARSSYNIVMKSEL